MIELRFCGPAKRLDAYLLESCPGLLAGELHKFYRQNKIKTEGKRLPLATRLQDGCTVRLYLPPEAEARAFLPKPPGPLPPVLYQDEHFLALEKPAGLPSLSEAGDSLLARARLHLGPQWALCHRLDTGTSGVILLAATEEALGLCEALLRRRALCKTYLCLCLGVPKVPEATLKAYLWKDAKKGFVSVMAKGQPGAKPIETAYRSLCTNGALSLLEVHPHTGRTHQIRAHLASAGLPLLGDGKYGSEAANRRYHCKYQCLCAKQLQFPEVLPAPFERYAGLCIQAGEPWFLQLLSHTHLE